jgi:tetratricopeptide (TPR) repeat protein
VTAAKGAARKEERVSLRALMHPASWRRPFEQSVEGERLRRRLLAFTGMWFLLAAMLAALGFGAILTISLMLMGGAVLLAGGLWLLRRNWVRQGLRLALRSIERASSKLKARRDELDLQQRLQRFATVTSHRARSLKARVSQVRRRAPDPARLQRRALRLNELGAQLRREGDHARAAEQHRAALAIVRDLGDRRAEALTLNNLALALAHTDGVAVAVRHFEEALVVFRELGDEELEGQVIANLGFVRRRQGREEDADNLLHAALGKLAPESSAYRQVEAQLRRAG